ncbi:archease [Streptomyces oryzae]|uniref:Archease n=1 Tax=Streptomyces oryzae TaxID=1434886 RepID=A0ABS3XKS1_9ACTN|nr:archease [Streptomyces oryzae]MBO8195681.1 archease [Streptomyces oryzae]
MAGGTAESADDGRSRQHEERGHRAVPHTADVRIEAWGADREQCLSEAVLGMVDCFADLSGAEAHSVREVQVAGDSDADLLAALLDEVVFRLEVHGEVPVAVGTESGGVSLGRETADVRLTVTDLASVQVTGAPPKAVSWNELHLAPGPSGWSCAVTVDV